MRLPEHPTYPNTDRRILVGDLVVQPNAHDRYPCVVTGIDAKFVHVTSLVTQHESPTYPCLVSPAPDELVRQVRERLSPESVERWRREMTKAGVTVLRIDIASERNPRIYLARFPEGVDPQDIKLSSIVERLLPERAARHVSHVSFVDPADVKDPAELDELIDKEPTELDLTPMTPVERALDCLERVAVGNDDASDLETIRDALVDMAGQLGIEVPVTELCPEEWNDCWDDGWDD